MISVLIPAAGSGERLGADRPKALVEVAGAPLIAWSVRALAEVSDVIEILVAAPAGQEHAFEAVRDRIDCALWRPVLTGGAERADSVAALVAHATSDLVLVHDAARPCVEAAWVESLVRELGSAEAGVPGVPVRDTLKRARDGVVIETIDRDGAFAVQTPQLFRRDLLVRAHALRARSPELARATDDAMLVEALGVPVRLLTGSASNVKVTFPDDVDHAARFLTRAAHR